MKDNQESEIVGDDAKAASLTSGGADLKDEKGSEKDRQSSEFSAGEIPVAASSDEASGATVLDGKLPPEQQSCEITCRNEEGELVSQGKFEVARELPPGFIEKGGYFYWQPVPDKSGNDRPDMYISDAFEISAETRGVDGRNWGKLLRWKDKDGRQHEWAMPLSMLAGDGADMRRELMSRGLSIAPNRAGREQLNVLLQAVSRRARATAVSRIGWHSGAFVLPDETIGAAGEERLLLQTETPLLDGFHVLGDLRQWHAVVGNRLGGNSRLIMAASAALAAPLLHLVNEESGGINLVGASSIGKSTAAAVAASIWGGPTYVRQWRATANGLEGIAAAHCDLLLILDEIGQIHGREAGEVAYMLANGSGKSRASRSGSARAPQQWRCLFLSTGEITLSDKIAEDRRRRVKAGQAVRCLDIPADAGAGHGLFEDLHGAENGDEFARQLKSGAAAVHGVAGREYLRLIVDHKESIATDVREHQAEFISSYVARGADGQVVRAAGRFGLIAAAGELGAQLGILPIPVSAATDAAAVCFNAWVDQRGGFGAAEVDAAISQVAKFLEQHGESRFAPLSGDGTTNERLIINRAGFREIVDGVMQFYVLCETWKSEVCAGLDMRTVNKILRDRGFLHPDPDPEDNKSCARRRLPGMGSVRVYHISADIMARGGAA